MEQFDSTLTFASAEAKIGSPFRFSIVLTSPACIQQMERASTSISDPFRQIFFPKPPKPFEKLFLILRPF